MVFFFKNKTLFKYKLYQQQQQKNLKTIMSHQIIFLNKNKKSTKCAINIIKLLR
jgi:hypothetical protein